MLSVAPERRSEDVLDLLFGALADATRRGIVERLAVGEATVTELAAPFSISLPAISRHLKVLERASLITRSQRRAAARINQRRPPAGGLRVSGLSAAAHAMEFAIPPEQDEIRAAVRELCVRFPGEYWRALEPDRYPTEFVKALTEHGWLAALIPEEYGGAGLSARPRRA